MSFSSTTDTTAVPLKEEHRYRLPKEFVAKYAKRVPMFGFNGLGEITYRRTYSRIKPDGTNEQWHDTVERVVNGVYSLQKEHICTHALGWSEEHANRSAMEMYDRMWNFKFLPPGRGLWAMGTDIVEKRRLGAALNNCFSGDTKAWIRDRPESDFRLESLYSLAKRGASFEVISGVTGEPVGGATCKGFGVQTLNRVVVSPVGSSNVEFTFRATSNHRWILSGGVVTTDLKVGDVIPPLPYRDGIVSQFASEKRRVENSLCKDVAVGTGDWLIERAPLLGMHVAEVTPCGSVRLLDTPTSYVVRLIEEDIAAEPVYCIVEPTTQSFVLEGGIPTGNCAFISTADISQDTICGPFGFFMDAAMQGVGIGFDTKGAEKSVVVRMPSETDTRTILVPDSREGWVDATCDLIDSYVKYGSKAIKYDYSAIRPAGAPIKTFGGVACGYKPLEMLHDSIRETLNRSPSVSATTIVDLMNQIGVCVVAGGIRRTASISLGNPDDEFMDLKNYEKNPHRMTFGWASNNSIYAELGMDYSDAAKRISDNGEPGFVWLENMRAYSRMCDPPDHKDHRASGANPCSEMTLEAASAEGGAVGGELCNLTEVFPARCDNLEDFKRTLKFAYLYAKTVTLCKTQWPITNRIMMRNRRIGCSISGVAQLLAKIGMHEMKTWLVEGYATVQNWDRVYSEWLCIPRSIKTTTIKPSGSVSLLAGATPGMHFPLSRFYTRRMRLNRSSPLVEDLKAAGYHVEDCAIGGVEGTTVVAEFPVDVGEGVRTADTVSMWEQVALSVFLQKYWSDNQVSCTVTFREDEAKDIARALEHFQYELKGISFLRVDCTSYPQMPYEATDEETYNKNLAKVNPHALLVSTTGSAEDAVIERFCDGDKCVL
jgi:ribonucleoside-triphosphate reductase (thioredoxin)